MHLGRCFGSSGDSTGWVFAGLIGEVVSEYGRIDLSRISLAVGRHSVQTGYGRPEQVQAAKDQRLAFVQGSGQVEVTNSARERDTRPIIGQCQAAIGYRAIGAAQGEADIRTGIDAACRNGRAG